MGQITTHVLDTSSGRPAPGIEIKLYFNKSETWEFIDGGRTDGNGRIEDPVKTDKKPEAGVYKLKFETGSYFKERNTKSFYPYVEIIFEIASEEHYHIPLLISPYGYTTYRGS